MTAKNTSYETELTILIKEFEDGWKATESDASLGASMLEFIFRYVRLQHGVLKQPEQWPDLDTDTLHKLFTWDSSDPNLQLIQNVLKRFSVGREVDAVTLLKAAVQSKIDAFSKQQSNIAKSPRKPNPMQERIEGIVKINPDITSPEVVEKLANQAGPDDLIQAVDTLEIELEDGKTIQITAIKDRVSRAKKKILKKKNSR